MIFIKRAKISPPVEEVKKIDTQEEKAVQNFKVQAQKAIDIIQENHFHLRLWKAVGGRD